MLEMLTALRVLRITSFAVGLNHASIDHATVSSRHSLPIPFSSL